MLFFVIFIVFLGPCGSFQLWPQGHPHPDVTYKMDAHAHGEVIVTHNASYITHKYSVLNEFSHI